MLEGQPWLMQVLSSLSVSQSPVRVFMHMQGHSFRKDLVYISENQSDLPNFRGANRKRKTSSFQGYMLHEEA